MKVRSTLRLTNCLEIQQSNSSHFILVRGLRPALGTGYFFPVVCEDRSLWRTIEQIPDCRSR